MSDKYKQYLMSSSAKSQPADEVKKSKNEWLEVPNRLSSKQDSSRKDAHSMADRDRENFGDDDPSNIRKSNTSNMKV